MNNTINFAGNIITPSKIVCVGRNYADHISELGNEVPTEPVIFLKPNTSIADDLYMHEIDDIHYEGEICFLIKGSGILGVGFGLDLTKRAIQSKLKKKGLPWERAKAFDNSAVFSDFVSTPPNLSQLSMQLFINGQLTQSGGYQQMLNKPLSLVNEIASFMTLSDGDIIMSGTPAGVGKVTTGDNFVGKIYNGNELLVERSWQVKALTKPTN